MENPVDFIKEKAEALDHLARATGAVLDAIPGAIQSLTTLGNALNDLQAALDELKK